MPDPTLVVNDTFVGAPPAQLHVGPMVVEVVVVVVVLVVLLVVPVAAAVSCASPGRETAPGPGRSAEESTSRSKLGGTQKVLTRVAGVAGPPGTNAPAAAPIIVMVRAGLNMESVAAK